MNVKFFNVAESLERIFRKAVLGKRDINLAIVDWKENYEQLRPYLMQLKELLEQTGIKVYLCDAGDLVYDDCLKLGNQVIDIVYRIFLWDFNEFYSRAALQPLIKAVDENKVEFFVFVISRMYSAKANLALLSAMADSTAISSRARRAIGEFIPWTRLLKDQRTMYMGRKIDMLEYIAKNKDEFIIKPSVSSGGKGVIIGRDSSLGEWQSLIDNNLGSCSLIVQEFHKAVQLKMPVVDSNAKDVMIEDMQCLFSPFLIDGRIEGYYIRCQSADRNIISMGHGAIPTGSVLV